MQAACPSASLGAALVLPPCWAAQEARLPRTTDSAHSSQQGKFNRICLPDFFPHPEPNRKQVRKSKGNQFQHHFSDDPWWVGHHEVTSGLFLWVMGEHLALQPPEPHVPSAKHQDQLVSSCAQSSSATDPPRDLQTTHSCASVYPAANRVVYI